MTLYIWIVGGRRSRLSVMVSVSGHGKHVMEKLRFSLIWRSVLVTWICGQVRNLSNDPTVSSVRRSEEDESKGAAPGVASAYTGWR